MFSFPDFSMGKCCLGMLTCLRMHIQTTTVCEFAGCELIYSNCAVVEVSVWVIVVIAVTFGALKEALLRFIHSFFIVLAVSDILLIRMGGIFIF